MQQIPLTTDPRQSMMVSLGGQTVELHVWWQPLSEAWYLSLLTDAGIPIALGRQIASRSRLIGTPRFLGEIVAAPLGREAGSRAGRNAWEDTHKLLYLTPEEVRVARSAA